MARITKPLTATEINAAKPREKEYTLRDGNGLFLRIKKNGSKIWLFDYYRPISKQRTNIGFGTYPDLSLSAARQKRDEARCLLAQGIDPQEHQQKQAIQLFETSENTFEKVARHWFDLKKTKVTSDYAEDIWRSLERDVIPTLGHLPISSIKANTVIATLEPVKHRGTLETLKRLIQRTNEIMVFAVNTGLIDTNPISGIRHAFEQPQKKHMPTLKPAQLPELLHALASARITLQTRCLIEWSLHTMVRPSEAAGTRWDEIDFDQNLWTIPAQRMKKRREHSVPLTPQTIALLEVMRPISGNRDFVFPSHKDPQLPTNNQTANAALKRMGFAGLLVAHGLRSIASTTLKEDANKSPI